MLKNIPSQLKKLLFLSFILYSFPFVSYPLTDGDVWNWTWVSKAIRETGHFLTGPNDQAHGPLMAWTGAVFSTLGPTTFYWYAFFNILIGLLGIGFTWFICQKIWKNPAFSLFASVVFSTTLASTYLSRTPMYDWPAAIFYFGFTCFYWCYLREKTTSYLLLALACVGVGSLSRFSICMGLSGIFMILANVAHEGKVTQSSLIRIVRDGLFILGTVLLFNMPWLLGQAHAHGQSFVDKFFVDNIGRFVKSTRVHAKPLHNYHVFPLHTLLGLLPYSIFLIASFFQKGIFSRFKREEYLMPILAFLPCLVIFSLSGHTKLARYIAYIFPMATLFLSSQLFNEDIKHAWYRLRTERLFIGVLGVLIVGLSTLVVVYQKEVAQSPLFAMGVIGLLVGLHGVVYYVVRKRHDWILTNPLRIFYPMFVVYLLFFTVLTVEYNHAPFLTKVRDGIMKSLTQ